MTVSPPLLSEGGSNHAYTTLNRHDFGSASGSELWPQSDTNGGGGPAARSRSVGPHGAWGAAL